MSAEQVTEVTALSEAEHFDERLVPFSDRKYSVGVEKSYHVEVLPTGGVTGGVINLNLQSESAGFLDLNNSYFMLNLRVKKYVGAAISDITAGGSDDGFISIENLAPELIWSDVRTYLNGVDCSDETNRAYPWSAFVRAALDEPRDYGSSCVRQVLAPTIVNAQGTVYSGDRSATGVTVETSGYADCCVHGTLLGPDYDSNTLSCAQRDTLRWRLCQNSSISVIPGRNVTQYLTVLWKPRTGLFNQDKFIPPNVDMRIELTKAPDTLMWRTYANPADSVNGYIDWTESQVTFYARRVFPTASVREEIASAMLSSPMIYPILRSRVAIRNYASTTTTIAENALLQGLRPDLAVVMFLDSRSLLKSFNAVGQAGTRISAWHSAGSNTGYPSIATADPPDPTLRAVAPEVNEIYATWGSGRQVPMVPFRMATTYDRMRAYAAYKNACKSHGPAISYDAFMSSYNLFCFNFQDLDDQKPGEYKTDPTDRGSLNVYATLTQPLVQIGTLQGFTMLVVGLSGAEITISSDRTVRRLGF